MKKFLLTFTVAVCLILGVGAMSAQAETYTGSCGDNVTYELDTSTGVFTISGIGAMRNYGWNDVPWYRNGNYIKTVIIKDSVTSIGDYAFRNCSSLECITIPDR